jgi:hypothetical protein
MLMACFTLQHDKNIHSLEGKEGIPSKNLRHHQLPISMLEAAARPPVV